MRITIIADASHCPDTHAAGYAYWIASGRGKQGADGVFRAPVVSSTCAEMMALANALRMAVEKGLVQEGDKVLCQTDCQSAIDAFTQFRRNVRSEEKEVEEYVTELVERYNFKISFRHVKGHTSQPGARFTVNKICDERARRQMRLARGKAHLNNLRSIINERQPQRTFGHSY